MFKVTFDQDEECPVFWGSYISTPMSKFRRKHQCLKLNHPQLKAQKTCLSLTMQHNAVKEAPDYLKNFIVTPFLVPNLSVGNAAAQLDELSAMGLISTQEISIQGAELNH